MTISNEAIDLIKRFEGCELHAYLCPASVATIGYGHTENVKLGNVITQQQADELLLKDLVAFERAVNNMVIVQINDNQLGALVSFAFNVGKTALKKSTLLKKLNNKDYIGAANEFMRWNKVAGKPLKGLTNRRKAEKELFLK